MATRFYLRSTGTPEVAPAFRPVWEKTTAAVRRPMGTTAADTALAYITDTGSGVNPNDVLLAQFVSDPLAAGAVSGTLSGSIAAYETNNGLNAFVQVAVFLVDASGAWQADVFTGSVATAATIASTNGNAQEFWGTSAGSASQRYFTYAVTTQAITAGWRLVVEIGGRAASTSTSTMGMRFGDPVASSDLAATGGTTTGTAGTGRSWVEFSSDVVPASGALTPVQVGALQGRVLQAGAPSAQVGAVRGRVLAGQAVMAQVGGIRARALVKRWEPHVIENGVQVPVRVRGVIHDGVEIPLSTNGVADGPNHWNPVIR